MPFNWSDFSSTLVSLVVTLWVKDWLQFFPGFGWLRPTAWAERWQAQQMANEARSDTEGHPTTDTPPTSKDMKDLLTQLKGLRSDLVAREEAVRTREERYSNLEERLSMIVERLEQISSSDEGSAPREGAIHRPSSLPPLHERSSWDHIDDPRWVSRSV
ncbi:hypothetical protein DTO195F2_4986 [Paecilomyces variotii]|nr:hypothetical protein DTO195F2_4986 [Paecilomyces variotii]KAJ9368314.1 hypothetical protein DTO282E5_7026 [Paecilomyces variotii]